MKMTIENTTNTEYKNKGGKFVAVQKEVTRKEIIEIIGDKKYYEILEDANKFDFSYLTTKDYIIRFQK